MTLFYYYVLLWVLDAVMPTILCLVCGVVFCAFMAWFSVFDPFPIKR